MTPQESRERVIREFRKLYSRKNEWHPDATSHDVEQFITSVLAVECSIAERSVITHAMQQIEAGKQNGMEDGSSFNNYAWKAFNNGKDEAIAILQSLLPENNK